MREAASDGKQVACTARWRRCEIARFRYRLSHLLADGLAALHIAARPGGDRRHEFDREQRLTLERSRRSASQLAFDTDVSVALLVAGRIGGESLIEDGEVDDPLHQEQGPERHSSGVTTQAPVARTARLSTT